MLQHGGSVISTVFSQQRSPGFEPKLGTSVWSVCALSHVILPIQAQDFPKNKSFTSCINKG